MEEIIRELVGLASTTLIGVGIWALTQFARKYGIELSMTKQEQLATFARQAILGVEEKAIAILKAQGDKLTGAEKLEEAIESLLLKVPGISREEAAEVIHQQLPVVRGAAVDFGVAVLKKATRKKAGQ